MKRRSLASLYRSLSQKAHNESLHFCSRENASADYRQSSNSSSVFPSGRVSPHWPVPHESIDSALPGDGRDINNSRGVERKRKKLLLHVSARLRMRSTDQSPVPICPVYTADTATVHQGGRRRKLDVALSGLLRRIFGGQKLQDAAGWWLK